MSKPFFSVIIPTRNRAQMVKRAIQSVLDQTFTDFEIVVGINFTNDNTKEVVEGFEDERVRAFETEKSLGICQSFEFASSFAQGEYLTYLSDDDACSIVTLEIVADVIKNCKDNKLVGWSYCDYLLNEISENGSRAETDSVWISSFDGQVTTQSSQEIIKSRFINDGLISGTRTITDHRKYPALINAAYHQSLFSEIERRGISFFYPTLSPVKTCAINDLHAFVIALSLIERYSYIDYPLHIHTAWAKSATTTLDGSRNYYRASEEELLVPFRCYTNKTFAANALLLAAREVGNASHDRQLDWANFYQVVYDELAEITKAGVDTREDLANFFQALEKTPPEFQAAVRAKLPSRLHQSKSKFLNEAKKLVRPLYQKSGLSDFVNQTRKDKSGASFLLEGSENGFNTNLELARQMDKKWLEKFKRKS